MDGRMDHPETAPLRDPSHIQLPNPDTIAHARTVLLTAPDIAVSREAMPVSGKCRSDAHSQLLNGSQGP